MNKKLEEAKNSYIAQKRAELEEAEKLNELDQLTLVKTLRGKVDLHSAKVEILKEYAKEHFPDLVVKENWVPIILCYNGLEIAVYRESAKVKQKGRPFFSHYETPAIKAFQLWGERTDKIHSEERIEEHIKYFEEELATIKNVFKTIVAQIQYNKKTTSKPFVRFLENFFDTLENLYVYTFKPKRVAERVARAQGRLDYWLNLKENREQCIADYKIYQEAVNKFVKEELERREKVLDLKPLLAQIGVDEIEIGTDDGYLDLIELKEY